MNNEEVFISYSHDSPQHIRAVLTLSNRLRSDGIDCSIDQYEASPPEGWPRWMDNKIHSSKYVLLVCTEAYMNRVMGVTQVGKGLGVRWEGNLIYQHIYNSGSTNTKFIPVILDESSRPFVPRPIQGATIYCTAVESEYEDLYARLTDQPRIAKPPLGKRRPLPEKSVKTNPSMFITMPIDIDAWNAAKWSATFFAFQDGRPPILGLGFRNRFAARHIFEEWHERYGDRDEYEEIRVSIVEWDIKGQEPGYSVHIGSDPKTAIERFKAAGFPFDDDILMCVSRMNRMTTPNGMQNVVNFKASFRRHKTYYLTPGQISEDCKKLEPIFDLSILKSKIHFRLASEIERHDEDWVVVNPDRD